MKDTYAITGKGVIKRVSGSGEVLEEVPFTNLVVSPGKNIVIKGLVGTTSSTQITQIAIGRSVTPPADTDIRLGLGEVKANISSSTERTNNQAKFVAIFSDRSVPNGQYSEIGLYAGNTLFARALPATRVTKGSGDDLIVEYEVAIP